jgi:hypothetical protein
VRWLACNPPAPRAGSDRAAVREPPAVLVAAALLPPVGKLSLRPGNVLAIDHVTSYS